MNADDPKFTAYALGELEPAECAAVEAALRAQPALAAELEEMRHFTAQLRGELHAEEGAPLRPEQRAAVLGLAPRIVAGPRAWWCRPWVQSAAAACVIVGVSAAIIARMEMKTPSLTARGETRERGVKLRLEPEVEAKNAPVETDRLAVPAPALAAAKPAGAPPNVDTNFSLGIPMTAPMDGRLFSPMAPSANPGNGTVNMSGGQSVASSDAATMNRGSILDEPKLREKLKAETKLLAERGRSATSSALPVIRQRFATFAGIDQGSAERGYNPAKALPEVPPRASDRYAAKESEQDPAGGPVAVLEKKRTLETEVLDAKARLEAAQRKISALSAAGNADQVNRLNKDVQDWEERVKAGRDQLAQIEADLPGTEAYDAIADNPFLAVRDQPLSTFSIDVDTASYANVRRFLNTNERPPKGAVRIEELVNYFHYDYPRPEGADPFSCALEVATCPWQTEHRLVRIGLQGREIRRENRPAANLVFLLDVSGSMQPENRLPLVKQSLRLLVDQLNADDTVAIAVYAGASGCVLEPTHDRDKMRAALDRLEAGGSTNGAAGIQLAYDLAQRSFKKGGTNRVILCTDGDFNVGITNQSELVSMIQDKAKTGIFLSVFGVGMGNLKDATLEKLADKGNGHYAYIDTLAEGRKVFVEQMTGTLFTIAKDVKVQVEFNPAQVGAYRLIGYEDRLLAKEDFNDDTKDAGEMGAGHTVTALYEVVPTGLEMPGAPAVDALKYQKAAKIEERGRREEVASKELLTVKLRYKQPDGDVSRKLEFPLTDSGATWEKSSRDFRWAAAVASFGLLLRDSPHKGSANWEMTFELATDGKSDDRDGYRAEFVGLVEKAKALSR